MHILNCNKVLSSYLKNLSNEYLIICLHVRNIIEIENRIRDSISDLDNEVIEMDVEILKSINKLEEIKPIIEKYFEYAYDDEIDLFINKVNNLKKDMPIYNSNILNSIKDKRFFYFLVNIFNKEINQSRIYTLKIHLLNKINNEYFQILYLALISIFCSTHQTQIEYLKDSYSQLITKYPLHFEKYDDNKFYIWAKKYMDNDIENKRTSRSTYYSPMTVEEYKPAIHAIFDALYIEQPYAYQALKDKLLNAWYQKNYRQRNKGKKGYFFLTDRTHACLDILAKKDNVSKEKVLESLINEKYAIECKDHNGNDKYS
ncbi:hypothetical protein [Acinetobacter guerrae]|uniref:hypothetical protein n=1 Tax=Acinetobacter guerrae TaxID=1843371 RepID=UPI00125F5AB0|nr:hypothetical protein [Acinetobacter guerrae]